MEYNHYLYQMMVIVGALMMLVDYDLNFWAVEVAVG